MGSSTAGPLAMFSIVTAQSRCFAETLGLVPHRLQHMCGVQSSQLHVCIWAYSHFRSRHCDKRTMRSWHCCRPPGVSFPLPLVCQACSASGSFETRDRVEPANIIYLALFAHPILPCVSATVQGSTGWDILHRIPASSNKLHSSMISAGAGNHAIAPALMICSSRPQRKSLSQLQ